MGWLDKLFKKQNRTMKYADALNGYMPMYSQFGNNIYASDVVQQAINCIAQEMKKLQPSHVTEKGMDTIPVSRDIQTILNAPNQLMTTSDFIEKIIWQLYFNYNSFIIPTYYVTETKTGSFVRTYTGLYPIQPTQVDFIQDESNRIYVRFRFANNYETTVAYDDIIHIRYKYSVNEYMGGNESGQPDNDALLQTLRINDDLLKGIAKAMKASYAVNGVVRYNTMIDDGTIEANIRELERKLQNSESGFLPLDLKSEFTPIERKVELVDEKTLKFIDEKILRHFGVPLAILIGDYTKEQYEAFYQKTLEPLVITLSQAFTKGLFSKDKIARGNKIKFYPRDLVFMSVDQTLEMIRLLGDSGALYENEKRVALGLKPLKELEGVRLQSLNYVNVDIAAKYQIGNEKNGGNADDDESEQDNTNENE